MKTPVLLFFLVVSARAVAAQLPPSYQDTFADSLEVKLILEAEDQRAGLHNLLSEHYLRNAPGKAMENARAAHRQAEQRGQNVEKSRALRNLGLAHQGLTSNYDSALYYCFRSLQLSDSRGYKQQSIETQIAIADIYGEVGNYFKSIDFLTKAQVMATETAWPDKVVTIEIRRAEALMNLQFTGEALELLKSALKRCKLHDLRLAEGKVRMAMAGYYLQYSSPDLAMESIKIADEIFAEMGSEEDKARALFFLGEWHRIFGDPAEAIAHYQKSLDARKKQGDLTGIAEAYLFVGLCYNKLSEWDVAIENLEQGRYIAEKINNKALLRRCYNQLFLAHSSRGDLKKAIEFRDLYVAIIELIYSEESDRQIAEQQAKFEIEQKDRELEIQQVRLENEMQRVERQRTFNLILSLLVLGLLGSGAFIFLLYRKNLESNRKIKEINRRVVAQNEELKQLNDTKNKFFSIIGHDLKGPMASLSSFLSLLKNHLHSMSEQEIVAVATDLDKATQNLQSLLENLLTWARSQTDKIDIKPEKMDVCALVKANFSLLKTQAGHKNIELSLSCPDAAWCLADRNMLDTVMRNLLSNAIKFTHAHGTVAVKVEEWKDAVEISVRDNGVGMDAETQKKIFDLGAKHTTPGTNKEKGTGLGLILCKEFIEKNGGQLRVSSKVGEGTVFSFALPKA